MRVVTPISRKPVGSRAFDLLVARDLANPFAPGEVITDAKHHYQVVSVEGTSRPAEVNLLVKLVAN